MLMTTLRGRGGQEDLDRRIEALRELDRLKPWLEAFISQAIGRTRLERLLTAQEGRSRTPDIQKLVAVMLAQWDDVFAARLRPHVRTYLRELKDIRNRAAHDEPFSGLETAPPPDLRRELRIAS